MILHVSRLPCHSSSRDKWVFYSFTSTLCHTLYIKTTKDVVDWPRLAVKAHTATSPLGRGGNKKMSWDKDSKCALKQSKTKNYFKDSKVHACKAKQRITSLLHMGRQVFSHLQAIRAPSCRMVTLEDKSHHSECPAFLLHPWALHVEHDPYGVGYPLGQLRSALLAVSPSDLCIPSSLMQWYGGKKALCSV